MPRQKRSWQESELSSEVEESVDAVCKEVKREKDDSIASKAILSLMSKLGVTHKKLELDQQALPSFSSTTWDDACAAFHLDPEKSFRQLEEFQVPDLILPPTVHERILKLAAMMLDVYKDPEDQKTEASHVRLLEAWHVPICQLFQGRIIDKPEARLGGTSVSSGGGIEHELYALNGGVLLLVGELKSSVHSNFVDEAQALFELEAAFVYNRELGLDPQPPVHAFLTDLITFKFFKYDGRNFARQDSIVLHDHLEFDAFLSGMMPVAERIFSTIMDGFIDHLEAMADKFRGRGEHGDRSDVSSSDAKVWTRASARATVQAQRRPYARPSTAIWEAAHQKAVHAREFLTRKSVQVTKRQAEKQGREGLRLLGESVRTLQKLSSMEDWDEEQLQRTIKTLLDEHSWGA
ncbi:uncharacterized protein EI90DRAFT_1747766 [Cantharellus anzutake]|uniref:uncharacterized protein n=1 Tax=Cantharellus anzutake TaxID=1750568 RepID=UPI00190596DF|nr:uncharacterized protein EI90DRAFT_1747766 [Cantharellus anzutake]KAF8341533.1 hypothetical protein EI90DRAFT_1747766 [Cantharellus anzutake]